MKIYKNTLHKIASPVGLLIALTILSPACTEQMNQVNGEHFEYVVLDDISKSHGELKTAFDSLKFHEDLMKEFGLSEGEPTSNGIKLFISGIGKPYIPSVNMVSLEAKNWLLNPRKDRIEETDQFISDSENLIMRLFSAPAEDQSSNLYRGIMNSLSLLDHKKTHRKLILRSDLIESSVVVSMDSFADDPKGINDEYETLKRALLESEPVLPEYAGTTIVMICPGDELLTYEASLFWTRFFEEHGLLVEVRASY